MDKQRTPETGDSAKETSQSPQAGDTPTGPAPQGTGDQPGGSTYQPGQGGIGGGGYQPGQSAMPGGITSRPNQDGGHGTDSGES